MSSIELYFLLLLLLSIKLTFRFLLWPLACSFEMNAVFDIIMAAHPFCVYTPMCIFKLQLLRFPLCECKKSPFLFTTVFL